jgi:O-Antigen ligase
MIRDALLAAGLLFAMFAQLRYSDPPIGIGEACLVAWFGLTLGRSISWLSAPTSRAFLQLAVFWLLIGIALCIGTMVAIIIGERNVNALFIHDIGAYALVAGMSLLAAFQADAAKRLRRVASFLVVFGSVYLTVLLAQWCGVVSISGVEIWFYDRLIGWSTNANQLALLCLILILLSFHLAETARRPAARLAALCCAGLPIWAGYLTRSDAFLIALGLSLPCIIGLRCARALFAARQAGLAASFVLAAFAVPAVLASSSPLAFVLMADYFGERPQQQPNQGVERDFAHRTELWEQAFARGFESRLLGLGPGPHLTRPANLNEPRWDALPDFEAHNTLLDIFLQGGLIAVGSLLWLGITAVRAALSASLCSLPILVIAMSGFALTHFIMRHPVFWFVIVSALVASSSGAKRAAGGYGSEHQNATRRREARV